jgi:uncharacterized protein (TIGR02246 family)
MKRLFIVLFISGLTTMTACIQSNSPSAPPTVDSREADAKIIRDGEITWNKDWAAKDVERILSHYADDGSLEAASLPIMTGKEAIRSGIKMLLSDPNLSLTFEAVQVEVAKSGELAYTRGTYAFASTDPKTNQPVTEKGKYLTVYKKQPDGAWKAIQDMNSPDALAESAK